MVVWMLWTHPQVRPMADRARAWVSALLDTWRHHIPFDSAPSATEPAVPPMRALPTGPSPSTEALPPRAPKTHATPVDSPPLARSSDFERLNHHLDRMNHALEQFSARLRERMERRGDD
ncbi:MAG: hypothetical protein CMJ18_27515 [Phycisphaeraceae bacterium]|nr:hypothetical protein [Phycisphaeraceae bacterium]